MQMPTREQLYGKHTRFTTIPTDEYEQLLQLKAENEKLKEELAQEREDCTGACPNVQELEVLTQKLEKARGYFKHIEQLPCAYKEGIEYHVIVAQQALKELNT